MKAKTVKLLKVMSIIAIALAMVVVGVSGPTMNASATETVKEASNDGNGVVYVEYNNVDPSTYWGVKAPKYTGVDGNDVGYFFGGWYTKSGNTYTPVENQQGLTGTVVAKFVPAQTLSVKCQNWAGTVAGSDKVLIRVVSATDNLNYKQFGFQVSKFDEGNWVQFSDFTTETVYKKFDYYAAANDENPTASFEPSQLFGDAATRFTTCTVGKIPADKHGTIICIKPFWETLDGVRVYGLSKFAHVEDGYVHEIDGESYMYVNVPVNLNILNEDNVAAVGRLDVTSVDGLEFLGEEGIEYGKVFDEMDFHVTSDENGKAQIRCIGYSSDLTDYTNMDIYVNLRFIRSADNAQPNANQFYKFMVDEEDFCKSDETIIEGEDVNVWSVIY